MVTDHPEKIIAPRPAVAVYGPVLDHPYGFHPDPCRFSPLPLLPALLEDSGQQVYILAP